MVLISDSTWARYNKLISDAAEEFGQAPIIWVRHKFSMPRFGEDDEADNSGSEEIQLLGLFSYNYFRQWKVTVATTSGEIDKSSEAIVFSTRYLNGLGYLNAEGWMDYKADLDRFIHKGIVYKARGDTPLSQGKDEDLLFMIVLQREEIETNNPRSIVQGD